jgi:hypothetical protein
MHRYERWIVRRYLANAVRSSRFVRPPYAGSEIFPWIDDHSRLLGLPKLACGTLSSRRRMASESPTHAEHWKAWRDAAIGIAREPAPHPSPLQKRLDWLAQACSLNAAQGRVLGLMARAVRAPEVRRLVEAVDDRFHADGLELKPFLETTSELVELSTRGKLAELGLIDAQDNSSLSVVVHRYLSLPRFNPCKLSNLLLGDPPGFVLKLSGLTPADFATVARKASVLGERDSKTVAQWLEYEAQTKPDAGRRRIGF